ncbi:glycosyltransferase family 4 protein [Phenylobacterium sp. VNQ135]|uniref:glycosyltransferase family 4 protein n=1 Tax=Phenylobacterium sp. VNQ135 TaxID=3400922 RepID=UPI003C09699D
MDYLYRSHNREYIYTREQAKLVQGLRPRLSSMMNLSGLQRFEREVIGRSREFFDISHADLAAWKAEGFEHGHWLPPVIDQDYGEALARQVAWCPEWDVGYLGNLVNANNTHGVLWFLREVVPQLRQASPRIKIRIAGSHPTKSVIEACRVARVTLLPNPADARAILRGSKVLINPVFQGSGVNLKSIEMLHTPAALVSTAVGVGGLPPSVAEQFIVANAADPFARGIMKALARAPDQTSMLRRRAAREAFSQASMRPLMEALERSTAT